MRYSLALPVPVVVVHNNEFHIDALGNVIGEGGVSLFAVTELPVGAEVEMMFTHSHSAPPIRIRGTVRNRALYLFGIEFLAQSVAEQLELARLRTLFVTAM
jgi:hypothetical protein